ncbi:MAG: diphosphate--fructose-6-phosphate 1-phosphotransferase [Nitrospiraceae bacterium]|nr:diphosphate--fructose-6-phosphate 1-phosphotransferase [Nitrospiraceae bacterium]
MKKEVLAIVVGGGPAPGINGVISSATIEAINEGKEVLGIVGGFKTLFSGDTQSIIPLHIDDVSRIHTTGGSILRTSRDPIDDSAQEKFKALMKTLKDLRVRYLITIGGDGTAFMARWVEREARGRIAVVHVPKTIDNDLYLPGGRSSFGYHTARHWGVEIVKNIMEDAKTTGRWYFISTMGRNAGHLALGIGKASGAPVTLIPEEFPEQKLSVRKVTDVLEGAIIKRISMGKDHGVAILAEGISGKLDKDELESGEHTERDEAGRMRLSQIELGKIFKYTVQKSLEGRGIRTTIVYKSIGYELRAAAPIPYDTEYTRDLGYGAVRFLMCGGTGAMIVFDDGRMRPVSFVEMTDPSTGRIKVRLVDITSETYEVGRKYMIRLEKQDFENPEQLEALAAAGKMSVRDFKKRFSYIVG